MSNKYFTFIKMLRIDRGFSQLEIAKKLGISRSSYIAFEQGKTELSLSDRDIDKVLDNLCRLSEHQKIYFLWRPYLVDPKDDHILEVAVASGAESIVTHNIKDFKGVDKFGIRVIQPRKLLEGIK